jgi:hypothetical protein
MVVGEGGGTTGDEIEEGGRGEWHRSVTRTVVKHRRLMLRVMLESVTDRRWKLMRLFALVEMLRRRRKRAVRGIRLGI